MVEEDSDNDNGHFINPSKQLYQASVFIYKHGQNSSSYRIMIRTR